MRTRLTTLSDAERVAHERDLGRGRKRSERERLRDAGRPDPAAIDRAVVDTIRLMLSNDTTGCRPVRLDDIVKGVVGQLLLRSRRACAEDGQALYSREGVHDALQARLLTPPRPAKAA